MRQGLLTKDNIVDRSKWPNPYGGAWDGEPDFAQWRDTESGYLCRVSRNGFGGVWCGYVGLTAEHPLYRVSYSQPAQCLTGLLDAMKERPMRENAGVSLMLGLMMGKVEPIAAHVLDVHGDVTFAGEHTKFDKDHPTLGGGEALPDGLWWIGFDCGHSGDLCPAHGGIIREVLAGGVYRTMDWVMIETERLAIQLRKVADEYVNPSLN